MGLIQGEPTKRDADLAAEATRESWQALLDRLSLLVQAKSLPERQSIRNDVLGAIHVHMARRSYENRVNWQIEHNVNEPKPEAPSTPIPPMSTQPEAPIVTELKQMYPELAKAYGHEVPPKAKAEMQMPETSFTVVSRAPGYAIQNVSGTWTGKIEEVRALIEADAREHYPFGHRNLRINNDWTFSYVGHTD